MRKKLLCIVVAAFLAFSACPAGALAKGGAEATYQLSAVKKIKLNRTKATLCTGDTLALCASTNPKSAAKKVKWRSSNRKAATVSARGGVKAKAPGEAVIVATVGGRKASCVVTVLKKPAAPKAFKAAPQGTLVSLSWKKAAVDGYEIYMAQASAGKTPGAYKRLKKLGAGAASYTMRTTLDKDYYFKIRCFKKTGGKTARSNFSPVASIQGKAPEPVVVPPPGVPAGSPTAPAPSGFYGEGMHRVGTDMPAGVYVLRPTSASAGYFHVTTADGTAPFYESFHGFSIVEVRNCETLELRQCRAVLLEKDSGALVAGDTLADGIYLVGTHIRAKTYTLAPTGDEPAYFEVRTNARRDPGGVVSWDEFSSAAHVPVTDGQYLVVKRCSFSVA